MDMAGWELVPCLGCLRDELNLIAPNRDRKSDGTIGDAAHQDSVSDHNDDEIGRVPIRDADSRHEVHAIDLDADLREPNLTMEMVVQHVVARCRSGLEKRLRYVIYNYRIWEASNGWRQRKYSGKNGHTEHAHFSASYESKHEASTASWHLEDIPVALTNADRNWIVEQIDKRADQTEANIIRAISGVPKGVLDAKTDDPSNKDRTVRDHLRDLSQVRDYDVAASNAIPGAIKAGSPLADRTAAAREVLSSATE